MLLLSTGILRSVGYLSYAIASYDNLLSNTYIKFIKNELIRTWLSLSNVKDFDEQDAHSQIGIIYDWLSSQKFSYKFALKNFEEFYNKNQSAITEETQKLLLKYSETIAHKLHKDNDIAKLILNDINRIVRGTH